MSSEEPTSDLVRVAAILIRHSTRILDKLEELLDFKLTDARLAAQPKPEGEPGEPLKWDSPPTSCEERYYITRRNKLAWTLYDRELKAGVEGECGVYPSLEQAERAKKLYEETDQFETRTRGLTQSEAQRIYPEGPPCSCGGNPQDFEGPLPACPVHGVEQPAFPHLIFPHNLEPCDLCSHTFGNHTLGVTSKPTIRACGVMKCNCENFKRWTGAQSGTCAPPPQSLGTGLGFSSTEPILRLSVPSAEELHAGIETALSSEATYNLELDHLETAIRHHLYVCPLPCGNLRKAVGYEPGIQLAIPTSLPFASIEDAGGPDPTPFAPFADATHTLDCGCVIFQAGSRALCEMHAPAQGRPAKWVRHIGVDYGYTPPPDPRKQGNK